MLNYQNPSLILLLISLLWACSPIYEDEDFFQPIQTDTYQLDEYAGDTGIELDSKYALDPDNIHEIQYQSFDGKSEQNISAIFIGDVNRIDQTTVIAYAHDRQANIDYYWPRAKLLANLDLALYGVMILDYRGYGKSSGKPSEAGLIADVDHALRWLKDNGLSNDRLIMYGYGLGSAPVIELAANPRSLSPAKIILEAPLASMEYLIQDATSLAVPGNYFSDLLFDNVKTIKNVQQPLMWIHGTNDKEYSLKQGELVFNNHPGTVGVDKLAYRITGASHHDLPTRFNSGFDGYLFNIQNFIESL